MGEEITADKKHRYIGNYDTNDNAIGTSANETFDLKTGDDTIQFDISNGKKIGKNTIYLTPEEDLKVYLNGDTSENSVSYKISGNDIIATVYKGTTSLGTLTFKNAGKANAVGSLKVWGTNNNIASTNLLTQTYTINKSKSKKGVKIKGTALNETITGSKKADTIYTGSGNDTIYSGKGKDTIIVNGKGNKDIYIHKNDGNKTIKFQNVQNTDDVTLYLDDTYYWGPIDPIKKGNDLYLKTSYYDFGTGKTTTKTYTLVDYFKDGSLAPENLYYKDGDDDAEKLSDYLADSNNSGLKVYGDKKRNVVGTDYDEILYGSSKKDIISTGSGYDVIHTGKGNDKIIINGVGTKNLYISDNNGNKVVKCGSMTEQIKLYLNNTDVLSYEKDGNDLILYRTFDSGKTTKTEKVTFENLLQTDDELDTLYIGDTKFSSLQNLTIFAHQNIINRKGKFDVTNDDNLKIIKGSSKKDTITVTSSAAPHIFAGAGNDIIKVSSSEAIINGGKGNDTVNIKTASAVIINHKSSDGNDIINPETSGSYIYLNLSLQSKDFNNNKYYSDYFTGARMGFKQSGNNLILQVPVSKSKYETITFKDYFTNESYYENTYINDVDINNHLSNYLNEDIHRWDGKLNKLVKDWAFWATGIYDKENKETHYLGMGEDYENYYEYKGTGKAIMYGDSSYDHYLIKLNSKSNLKIADLGGTNFAHIQNNLSTLRFFFNVAKDSDGYGYVSTSDSDTLSDNMFVFDSKKSLTTKNIKNIFNDKNGKGVLNIENYFKENDGEEYTWQFGSGRLRIYASKNIMKDCLANTDYYNDVFDYNTLIDKVRQNVAGWLSNHTQYTDAFDVIRTGSDKDIASLLKIYNAVKPIYDTGH